VIADIAVIARDRKSKSFTAEARRRGGTEKNGKGRNTGTGIAEIAVIADIARNRKNQTYRAPWTSSRVCEQIA